MEKANSRASSVDAILYCEGPGSTLGLRVALTLAKTLRSQVRPEPRCFSYNALHAAALLCENPDMPILTDYRQGQWYLRETSGEIRVLQETEAQLVAAESQPLPQRKSWKKFPQTGPAVDHDLRKLEGLRSLRPILKPAESLSLFDLRPATFRKWQQS